MSNTLRNALINIFESHESRVGRIVGWTLATLILISTASFVIETTDWGYKYKVYFHKFDLLVLVIFSIEYLIRLCIAPRPWLFFRSPLAMIDLSVLVVFGLSLSNFAFLRGFRVLKILQLLKIIRYSETMTSFLGTFRNYTNELKIFWITFVLVLFLSSSGLYFLEKDINPSFATIPDSIWWSVVTVTTVGYGDSVPISAAGKLLASVVMFLGLGVIAILTAIVTKMFMDHFFGMRHHTCLQCHFPRHQFDALFCKNCGYKLDTPQPKFNNQT